jgi:peptidyl-prolyl cis-trans isomerase SurA
LAASQCGTDRHARRFPAPEPTSSSVMGRGFLYHAARAAGGCAALLLAALACTLAPPLHAQELDAIVAIVNDDVIMRTELEDRVRTVRSQLREQGTELPPGTVLERQVLDRLILTKLQTQMAEETGIRVDDESLNRTISNIAAENKVSLEQFRAILEEDGYSYEKFREDIRNEILVSRLRQRQVDNRVTVTEQEVENFLSSQAQQGQASVEYRLRHILIALPDAPSAEEMDEAEAQATMIMEKLRGGADFAQLAAAYSRGQQALEGGDLGWRRPDQVPSLFVDVVARMKPGDISDLIRSPGGIHILKLDDVRDSARRVVTQTHARHILIRTNEVVTDADARLRLDQLRLRLEGGDDFGELARAHSADTVSASNGGDLGWTNPGDLVPAFEEVMNSLQPGEISRPFQTDYGWHIVQVLERREHDSTEDMKRSQARETIRRRKLEEAREAWLRQLRDEAYVEYRL